MSQRRSSMKWLAAAVLVVGLAAGIVLLVLAAGRPKQFVDHMARAPVGCTTTLSFARGGTYYVWEESSSHELTPIEGCSPSAGDGQFRAELAGEGITVVQLDPADAPTYSIDGYASTRSVTRVDLANAAQVELVVSGPDTKVVAAVGRDPNSGVSMMRAAGFGSIVAGIGLAALLLLLGRKPAPAAATPDGSGYQPSDYVQQPYHPYQQPYGQQAPYPPQSPYEQPAQYPYEQPQSQPGGWSAPDGSQRRE